MTHRVWLRRGRSKWYHDHADVRSIEKKILEELFTAWKQIERATHISLIRHGSELHLVEVVFTSLPIPPAAVLIYISQPTSAVQLRVTCIIIKKSLQAMSSKSYLLQNRVWAIQPQDFEKAKVINAVQQYNYGFECKMNNRESGGWEKKWGTGRERKREW